MDTGTDELQSDGRDAQQLIENDSLSNPTPSDCRLAFGRAGFLFRLNSVSTGNRIPLALAKYVDGVRTKRAEGFPLAVRPIDKDAID